MKNKLDDHIITEHFIMCFADGCDAEVRDTSERDLADWAESEGFVVRDDETFCSDHADVEGNE